MVAPLLRDVESPASSDDESLPLQVKRLTSNRPHHTDDLPKTLSQAKSSRIDLSKRFVFVCPTRLSKQFDTLPHQAKDMALLVFRCARHHVFDDTKAERRARMRARVDTGAPGKLPRSKRRPAEESVAVKPRMPLNAVGRRYSNEFLEWLRTKEKEDCVFWYRPSRDLEGLSKFFESKTDPVRELPYRPLLLDPTWWRVRFDRSRARYVSNPTAIAEQISTRHRAPSDADLRSMELTELVLKELLFQSNPTLEPVAEWPAACSGNGSRQVAWTEPEASYSSRGYITCPHTDLVAADQCVRGQPWGEPCSGRLDGLQVKWQTQEAIAQRQAAARALLGPNRLPPASPATPLPGRGDAGSRAGWMSAEPDGNPRPGPTRAGSCTPRSCTPREGFRRTPWAQTAPWPSPRR